MYDIIDKKIPIIFVVNKCPEDIFSDQEDRQLLMDEIKKTRKGTDFENYETFCINCINGKGFNTLLKGIFSKYEKYIIKDDDLSRIKDYSMPMEEFNKRFENTFFLQKMFF